MVKPVIALMCLIVSIYGCGTVENKGQEEKKNIPGRIVSLAPSLTKSLFILGAGDRVKGCTTYCVEPEEAKQKPKIGTLIKINVESIVALKPDLVLGMEFSDRKAVERLKSLGIRVELFTSSKNFENLCESFIRLGQLVGKESEAKEIVARSRKQIQVIRERVKSKKKLKIFWQLGAKPLFAATKGYFTNDYIVMANGINIAGEAENGIYSREEVLSGNPDVIIIISMGIPTQEEVNIWKKYTTIEAVKSNRIYVIDADKYCSPTPGGFVEALEELVGFLYPGELVDRNGREGPGDGIDHE